jgi:hypothetical protein
MAKKQKKRTTPRAWTKMDVRTLKQFSRDKPPVARISKTLKRTVGACVKKHRRLVCRLDIGEGQKKASHSTRLILGQPSPRLLVSATR